MKFSLRRSSWLVPWAVLVTLCLFLLLTSGSRLIAMKVIAFLVLPAGFLWLAGLFLVCWPRIRWRVRILFLSGWILYSLAGSPYFGNSLLHSLEKDYYALEVPKEPIDVLVLLGGGTARTPGGNAAMGAHGDRILRPAVHYHNGLAGKLITTGRSVTERGKDRLLSRETSEIWQSLGVPAEVIVEIPEPRNTAEEMTAVAKLAELHPEWKTIGLCSSASHLPRALKEASRVGLQVIPVPSDFRSTPMSFSPMYLIPQGRGFRDVQAALWEYLGMVL